MKLRATFVSSMRVWIFAGSEVAATTAGGYLWQGPQPTAKGQSLIREKDYPAKAQRRKGRKGAEKMDPRFREDDNWRSTGGG
jgi:hypothetical protein